MDILQDALQVNKEALSKTIKSLKYFPIIMLVLLISMVLKLGSNILTPYVLRVIQSGYLIGFIGYIVDVMSQSLLVSCLYSVVMGDKLTFKNFLNDWSRFISPIMSVRFLFWIIEMAISLLTPGMTMLAPIIAFALYFIKTPMLETIYIGQEVGTQAMVEIFDFLKRNFLQWLPIAIITALVLVQTSVAGHMLLSIFNNPRLLLTVIVSLFILAFVYIYKGHLYKILYRSNIRSRKFQGAFYR